mgnify:CR=1 FL=1
MRSSGPRAATGERRSTSVEETEAIAAEIARVAAAERIDRVVLVYMPYIYNVVPEVMRVRGHSHFDFPFHREQKRTLLTQARAAGFAVVDFVEIADAEQQASASQFGPLALFIDHTHPSPRGVERLASAIDAARARSPLRADR